MDHDDILHSLLLSFHEKFMRKIVQIFDMLLHIYLGRKYCENNLAYCTLYAYTIAISQKIWDLVSVLFKKFILDVGL